MDITDPMNGNIYCGGLDRSGDTGNYSLYYQDSLYQVNYTYINANHLKYTITQLSKPY